MRSVLFLLFSLILITKGAAQELNCNVLINAQKIQSLDKTRVDDMKKTIQDFMNQKRWTTDNFKNEERINCNLVITLDEVDGSFTNFKATVQVQSSRPVFGTSMESLMLNSVDNDKWEFAFQTGQNMDFNENSFTSNLISYLSFYAYIIIGIDYDSYSKGGGMKYLQKAQNIANNAATGTPKAKGWEQFDGTQARYMLIFNLVNQQFIPMRESLYDYHRLGLDQFAQQPDVARTKTLELLNKISVIKQQYTASNYINSFFTAKSPEIINIFSDASPADKVAAYNLLVQLDPARVEKYDAMKK